MQSTSDASHQSNLNPTMIKNGAGEEPSHLTMAAIKHLQDSSEKKHHTNLDYILQIVRMRDLVEGKASAAKSTNGGASNGAAATPEKKNKANIKYK